MDDMCVWEWSKVVWAMSDRVGNSDGETGSTGRLKKVRRIYIAYISCHIGHATINLVSHESLIKDILFEWMFTPRDHLT